jgi:LacI family transcriptional regulator, repressor for deo operon, udp, cdd, tsx, nupC, and nupG
MMPLPTERRHLLSDGVRVPEQISLIGFDDLEEAQLIPPPLTTVGVPDEVIRSALLELHVKRLRGPRVRPAEQVIPVDLGLRGSARRVRWLV